MSIDKLSKKQLNQLRKKFNHDISDDYIKRVVRKNHKKMKKFQHEILECL